MIRPSSVYQETIDHRSQIEKDFLTIKRVSTFHHYLLLNVQVVSQSIIVEIFSYHICNTRFLPGVGIKTYFYLG